MFPTNISQGRVFQGGGAVFLARIYGYGGALVTQATFSSILCNVFELTGTHPTTPASRTLTVSTVVFNALQTDAQWNYDLVGYNFADAVPASTFPTAQATYRVEYKFTPVSGAIFYMVFQVLAERVYSN